MWTDGLRRRPFRWDSVHGAHREISRLVSPDRAQVWNSWLDALHCSDESVPQFAQAGTDSRFNRAERLIQIHRYFLVGQLPEEGQFDSLSFLRIQAVHSFS